MHYLLRSLLLVGAVFLFWTGGATVPGLPLMSAVIQRPVPKPEPRSSKIRFATFNVSLFRDAAGALASELESGNSDSAKRIAEVIQTVRPDVILLNEVDYDREGRAIDALLQNFLAVGQNGREPLKYPHSFFAPVNTGIDSGLDLNRNSKLNEPDDAFGFGVHPGQYGMVVLSMYPIAKPVRTFQNFLWKDMPNALIPLIPETNQPYYSQEIQLEFRLSSKSHWDVPIVVGDEVVHFIVAHPTPPVFDGAEDRNGCRNHDEIRLIADLIFGADYVYDDLGQKGGLPKGSKFVVAGDLNADPHDGASRNFAVRQLTEHPLVNTSLTPKSNGAVEAAKLSGEANLKHAGDSACDTGDFNDRSVGNLRIDYVLPSANLELTDCGVFWPATSEPGAELASVSDHHLVWIDVTLTKPK